MHRSKEAALFRSLRTRAAGTIRESDAVRLGGRQIDDEIELGRLGRSGDRRVLLRAEFCRQVSTPPSS